MNDASQMDATKTSSVMTDEASAVLAGNENLTFRQAMGELQGIVEKLESNTLELEESLEQYERGIQLLRYLRVNLSQAQQKVQVLMGELEEPLDDDTIDTTLSKA